MRRFSNCQQFVINKFTGLLWNQSQLADDHKKASKHGQTKLEMAEMQTLLRRTTVLCLLAHCGTVDASTEAEISLAIEPANNICSSDRRNVPTTRNPNGLGSPLTRVFLFACAVCAVKDLKRLWRSNILLFAEQIIGRAVCRRRCLVDKVMRVSVSGLEA